MPFDRLLVPSHRHRAATLSFLVLSSIATVAHATPDADDAPARRYALHSVSVLGAATLTAGFFGTSQAGTGFEATVFSGSVAVRMVTHGFTLEPRVGADALVATGASGLYAVFAARTGLGAGWTFALGRSVAITPMLSYEVAYVGGGVTSNLSGLAHIASVELPLTVFFGRHAFVEVFVRGGFLDAFDEFAPLVAAGYRFGVVL